MYNAKEFTGGFVSEWAYVNTAQMAKSLAVKPNESVAATAGRVTADEVGIYQGAGFMVGGVGLMGAGVTACATGVLCPAGAVAAVGGGVIAADGAVVASYAAVNGGTNLSNLVTMAKSNASGGQWQSPSASYPKPIDPRTGRSVPMPNLDLKRVPEEARMNWGLKERGGFIAEWFRRGYAEPSGDGRSTIYTMLCRESVAGRMTSGTLCLCSAILINSSLTLGGQCMDRNEGRARYEQ